MIRTPSRLFAGFAGALALTAAACADAATETEAGTGAESAAAEAAAVQAPAAEPGADIVAAAPDSAWRTVEADNLLRIETRHGEIWVEMAPAFAPNHAARMRELARSDWFDFKVWHRVLDGFVAQGGGALDNPNITAPFPPLAAEFARLRGADLPISELQERPINPRSNRQTAPAGFYDGFPAGTQPIAQAAIRADGQVASWLIHCDGAASMARTSDPNSATAQFYIVRGQAEHLNTEYTVWGKVRAGMDAVRALGVGTLGQDRGFQPDFIEEFELASDLAEDARPAVQVMDTNSAAFAAYLEALTAANDGELPDVCEIDVPVRVLTP